MANKTYEDPSPEQAGAISGNARLLTEAFTELAGEALPPGRAGVAFLDGFINRQRGRDDTSNHGGLADMAACYVGEALVAEAGGRWVQDPEYGLGIWLTHDLVAFPFAKAAKHFANGEEDSVLSFFDTTVTLAADQWRRAAGGGAAARDGGGTL